MWFLFQNTRMKSMLYFWYPIAIVGICHCGIRQICRVPVNSHCQCNNNQTEDLSISCDFTNQSYAPSDRLIGGYTVYGTHVDALNFSGLHAKNIFNEFLEGIASVGKLILAHNQLTDFPVYVSSVRVEYVDLSHNRISALDTTQFSSEMTFLIRTLNLSHNWISAIPEFDMGYFPALKYLDLSFNEILIIGGEGLNMPHLITLDLSQNNISTVEVLDLGPDPKLMSLNLSRNNISNLHDKSFSSLWNLKTIDLSQNTQIRNVQSLIFPQHVSYLDLHSCGVKVIDECYLLHVRDLVYLDVSGNDIACSCELSWLFHQILVNREYREFGNLKQSTKYTGTKSDCFDTEKQKYSNIINITRSCTDEGRVNFHLKCKPYEVQQKYSALQAYVRNFEFEVSLEEDTISAKWSKNNSSLVHGFTFDVCQVDGSSYYDSAMLHPSVHSFSNSDHALCCGTFNVCIRILLNGTYTYHKVCEIVIPHNSKFIIGVLAGSLFLVPCLAVLIYVIVLDRKKQPGYIKGNVINSWIDAFINVCLLVSLFANALCNSGSVRQIHRTVGPAGQICDRSDLPHL